MSAVYTACASALEASCRLSCSEWAVEHLNIDSEVEGGRYRLDRTPYHREVLDAYSDPFVQEITLKWGAQLGKTTCELAMIGYSADQDPGSVLFLMPSEDLARSFSVERIEPMVMKTEAIRRHFNGRTVSRRDKKVLAYYFDRMRLNMAWATSPATMSSRPCRRLIADETNKYPAFSGREGDPISLAEERTKNFWNRKIVRASTPTVSGGVISREYERGDQRTYRVPCPHCGMYQRLVWTQVRYPEDEKDPQRIRTKRLAWYECAECAGVILDRHKPAMSSAGVWCPEGYEVENGAVVGDVPVTRHRSYWLGSLYSPWLTFSDMCAKYLECGHDPALLMNFTNSWQAEDWEEREENVELRDIVKLKTPYRLDALPAGVRFVTSGTDVQKNRIYFAVRGWGLGDESWLIDYGCCRGKDDLEAFGKRVMDAAYHTEDGRSMQAYGCIDGRYRKDEVVSFARGYGDRLRVTMGHNRSVPGKYFPTKIDKHYRTGKPLPQSYQVWMLDIVQFKDWIHSLRQKDVPVWHIRSDADTDYLKQVSSEHKITKRDGRGRAQTFWVIKQGSPQNHYFDCEVYAAARAWMEGIQFLPKDGIEVVGNAQSVGAPVIARPGGGHVDADGWYRGW